jgi:hypothetical protein
MRPLRARFWVESIVGAATALLALLTLAVPDWLETFFGLDPDAGDGSVERLIVFSLAAATVTLAALARIEWRRAALVR